MYVLLKKNQTHGLLAAKQATFALLIVGTDVKCYT